MKDLKTEINDAMRTGKITIGAKSVSGALLNSNPKLILVSSNCPNNVEEEIVYYSKLSNVPYKMLPNDSLELGSMCGRPFPVSTLGVIDEGESGILDMIKG